MDDTKHLGKGLSDLMKEKSDALTFASRKGGGSVTYLPIQNIFPNPYQPRRVFNPEAMQDLIHSIEVKGVLQPILVRPQKNTTNLFEIIAGERRWRAAQAANFMEIPAIIKNFTDREILEVALIENLQREDMTPLDEAQGYQTLQEKFGYTQQEIATRVGKSRSHIANLIRLLDLPEDIKKQLQKGEITPSHARTLLSATEEQKTELAKEATHISVRELEQKVKESKKSEEKSHISGKSEVVNDLLQIKLIEYEKDLRQKLGNAFKNLSQQKDEKFTIQLEFENFEDLSKWLEEFKKES